MYISLYKYVYIILYNYIRIHIFVIENWFEAILCYTHKFIFEIPLKMLNSKILLKKPVYKVNREGLSY